LEEIKDQRENGAKELVKVSKLWYNSFNDLFQKDDDATTFLKKPFLSPNFRSKEDQRVIERSIASIIMKGYQQATDLTSLAKSLKIPINPEFDKLVLVDNAPKII
jgi:hypothetical protein